MWRVANGLDNADLESKIDARLATHHNNRHSSLFTKYFFLRQKAEEKNVLFEDFLCNCIFLQNKTVPFLLQI